MSKKRGFTLTEVLVVLALVTVVFVAVGGLMIYMAQSSGSLIHQSEEIMLTQSIEGYIRGMITHEKVELEKMLAPFSIPENKNTEGKLRLENGNLYDYTFSEPKEVFKDTGLAVFRIYKEGNFYKCYMQYESGVEYDFIIGIVKNEWITGGE